MKSTGGSKQNIDTVFDKGFYYNEITDSSTLLKYRGKEH